MAFSSRARLTEIWTAIRRPSKVRLVPGPDARGTTLRVAIAQAVSPAPYTVLGWIVPDIAA